MGAISENVQYAKYSFTESWGTSYPHQYMQLYERRDRNRLPGFPNVALRSLPYTYNRIFVSLGSLKYSLSYLQNAGPPPVWLHNSWGGGFTWSNYDLTIWGTGDTFNAGRYSDLSINQANTSVRNQKVNLGVAFGEMHETIGLISKTVTRIAKAARYLKKGNPVACAQQLGLSSRSPRVRALNRKYSSRAKVASKGISNAFLEYSFGWKPLVSDISGSMVALYESQQARPPIVKAVGKSPIDYHHEQKRVNYLELAYPGGGVRQWIDRVDHITGQATTVYRYEVTNPVINQLSQLGLTNPLSTVYELLPFSFVVDWFANIGQCLDRGDLWYGKQFLDGSTTVFYNKVSVAEPGELVVQPSLVGSGSISVSSIVRKDTYMERAVHIYPPATRLVFSLPFSTWHAAAAVSLLRQIFN